MPDYDLILRNGTVYDGTGSPPVAADVAVSGDTIAAVSPLPHARAREELDAKGLVVAPGFINMLSWANETLIEDGRSQSDIRQGVTLEVLGEGRSMGPLNESMKREMVEQQGDIRYNVEWTTLGEYLEFLERCGVSCNITSFVGAATLRIHEIGYADRPPTPEELTRMRSLVRQAMAEGAVGISSALIYSPAAYARTDELIALAEEAAAAGGLYASHIRNEADGLLEALDEFLTIARQAGIRSEIYHLKASGRSNWSKLDTVIRAVDRARAEGLPITADMYTYAASSTGLDAVMPPWVQEGGHKAWVARLRDPNVRARVKQEMNTPSRAWDNGWLSVGSPDKILLVGFKNPSLKPLAGRTLAEIAAMRGTPPEDTAMDLVTEDDSEVGAVFFVMSEENVTKKIRCPWMSFCSDARSLATEGVFLKRNTHPRAYGSFARVLGKYVRDERALTMEEAIRRLAALPAANLGLQGRGRLAPGYFADIVAFDAATIRDNATYKEPHQYATGMVHVVVNGTPVLRDGDHTGATPGRFVRGPGRRQ